MPGLNQLKKFTSDIKDIGDEVKIRAQRGEKPAVVPLPEGISEEDDSEDFVLGMPEVSEEETAASDVSEEPSQSADDILASISEDSAGGDSELTPDLDALLNGTPAQNGDEPDLSAFLDEPDASQVPEETPLEDLDLDSLLKAAEEPAEEDLSLDSLQNIDPLNDSETEPEELSDAGSDNDQIPETNTVDAFDLPEMSFDMPSSSDEIPEASQDDVSVLEGLSELSEDVLSDAGAEGDDDFAFTGNAIDLNKDIPEEVAEEDGIMPESEEIEEVSDAESPLEPEAEPVTDELPGDDDSSLEEVETFDNLEEQPATPDVQELFSTDDLDASLEGVGEPSPLGDFELPDFDLPSSDNADGSSESAAEALLKKDDGLVDASVDVPADDFNFGDAAQEMGSDGDIDFGPVPAGDEFPVTDVSAGGEDDFLLDDGNFEIPGFSDTETAAFDKKGKPAAVDVADFSQAKAGKPKNTLTEEEYKKFRKNLSAYPLNLRLAIEDLIVKNEFTDDAVFEVVEKVLNKTPARQVATHLEKMLDITIDVPRDYERRSFAEYEAYKQSFQYQLKNRIIPGGIAATVLAVVGYLLFQAAVAFIYKPTMARILYKQGYTLLENNAYPQSEVKFAEAIEYKKKKNWYFKYARGYRDHKQYERAGKMYQKILNDFKNEKAAGLEWAEMELYDRFNFENAENIVRRKVLDYHINDADALLLLGDINLVWAETNPPKYEAAREQYSNLIQLYGANDLYMSRMMRYFIRTDKLRNVLELKNRFYPRKNSLCADDWVELSGYLLDKLYGPLSRSDEYLRSQIEDVRAMLEISIKADRSIPAGHYNIAKYFIHNSNFEASKNELKIALDCFDKLKTRSVKNTYIEIDTCRILGELYADNREYLKAQEVYTRGIDLFQSENEKVGLPGDKNTGALYADLGDIEYFISGDMEAALVDYEQAVANKNDTPSINYRIGRIRYINNDYEKALSSFIKAAESEDKDVNLLLSLGNVLSLRGDNFAAQGYYSHLLTLLNTEKNRHLMLFPQEKEDDNKLVEMFLKVNNNLGVTLYRIARQTGDSRKNAEATVRLSDSIRAWDALTRNKDSMVRLGGSNLALQNSKYLTSSNADFEPAIYTDIPKTLVDEKILQ